MAAEIFKGEESLKSKLELIIIPGSQKIYLQAMEEGSI